MPTKALTPEEQAELDRLLGEHAAAVKEAGAIAAMHGMDSAAFREADEKAGKLYQRIRELRGTTGEHWMGN